MKKILFFLILFILLLIVLWGFNYNNEEKNILTSPQNIDFWNGKILIMGNPKVNEEFVLSFMATPIENADHVFITFFIPENVILISGDLNWEGNVTKNEHINKSVILLIKDQGDYEFSVWIESSNYPSFNRAYWKHIISTFDKGIYSDFPSKEFISREQNATKI